MNPSTLPDDRPSRRVALVSGATQGIGYAIADRLAGDGVDMFLTARSEEALAKTGDELARQHGVRVGWQSLDMTTVGAGKKAADAALERFGAVDILVNNAGQSRNGSTESSAEEWAESNQVNFLSHLETIRTLLPGMQRASHGRVVNIVGTAYREPEDFSLGTTAKYGLVAWSKVLSRSSAPHGVTFNTVAVGLIDTPQIQSLLDHAPGLLDVVAQRVPMRRLGTPSDVARAVSFLTAREADFITGSTVTVDGGASTTIL